MVSCRYTMLRWHRSRQPVIIQHSYNNCCKMLTAEVKEAEAIYQCPVVLRAPNQYL